MTEFHLIGLAWPWLALMLAASSALGADGKPEGPPIREGIRWPGEDGKQNAVTVGISIIDFARISPDEEAFERAGYLDLSWTDPTLAGGKGQPMRGRLRFRKGDVWSPELEFVNAAEQVRSERDGDLYVDPEGRVVQRVRFSHKFRSPLHLKRFPFDRQALLILVSPFDPFAADIELVADLRATGKLPDVSLPDWAIDGVAARVESPRGGPSDRRFVFEAKVSRRYTFYLWRMFLPLALLAAANWSVFCVDEEAAPAKSGTAVTVLVSLVAFSYAIDFSLPKVPYFTFANTFSLTVFVSVLSVIFAVTAIHFIHNKRGEEPAERLQSLAGRGFPASFVAIILIQAAYSLW